MSRIQRLISFELKPIRIKKGKQHILKLAGVGNGKGDRVFTLLSPSSYFFFIYSIFLTFGCAVCHYSGFDSSDYDTV